jgi:hypothetical protein
MTNIIVTIISIVIFFIAKERYTNDYARLCSVIYGGVSTKTVWLVIMVISCIIGLIFGIMSHYTISNFFNSIN